MKCWLISTSDFDRNLLHENVEITNHVKIQDMNTTQHDRVDKREASIQHAMKSCTESLILVALGYEGLPVFCNVLSMTSPTCFESKTIIVIDTFGPTGSQVLTGFDKWNLVDVTSFISSSKDDASISVKVYYSCKRMKFIKDTIMMTFRQVQKATDVLGDATWLRMLIQSLAMTQACALDLVFQACDRIGLDRETLQHVLVHAAATSYQVKNRSTDCRSVSQGKAQQVLLNLVNVMAQQGFKTPLTCGVLSDTMTWNLGDKQSEEILEPRSIKPKDDDGQESQSQSVAVIGLGAIGLGLATCLSDHFQVIGCDRDDERLSKAKSGKLRTCKDIEEVVDELTAIIMVVKDCEQVSAIVEQIRTKIESRTKPLTIVLHTTMSPDSILAIEKRVQEINREVYCLEVPISGGPQRSQKGDLVAIVGGSRSAIDANRLLLSKLASHMYYAGELGSASKIKALHQIVGATNLVASFETFLAGLAYGLPRDVLLDAIMKHDAANKYFAERCPQLLEKNFSPEATLSIWTKDLEICERELSTVGIHSSLVTCLRSIFGRVSEDIGSMKADTMVVSWWSDWNRLLFGE